MVGGAHLDRNLRQKRKRHQAAALQMETRNPKSAIRNSQLLFQTRRHFLKDCQTGLGALALGSLLARDLPAVPTAAVNPLAPKAPHFAPKAKRVIYLHLTGSPPHLDLYDYKPELVKLNGEPCPDMFLKGKRFAF